MKINSSFTNKFTSLYRKKCNCRFYSSNKLPNDAIVFSGIQPTGVVHIGNYFGALRQWKEMCNSVQSKGQLYFATVDLHSLTIPKDPTLLRKWKKEALAAMIACGVDPKKSCIYHQSMIPEHSELMWILACSTTIGKLNRMTQWKSKLNLREYSSIADANVLEKLDLGLFIYPVLMAADILIYNATHVPVGADQVQHLELTRELARSFNSKYEKEFFNIPKEILNPICRIMSLRTPTKKMSKSDVNQKSVLYVNDKPEIIKSKINSAITDSDRSITYDPTGRPGVASLLDILSATLQKPVNDVLHEFSHLDGHAALKEVVADALINELNPIREKYDHLMKEKSYLEKIVSEGADEARLRASRNLKKIKKIVGLL